MDAQRRDAVELLEEQHREVEQLFSELESEGSPDEKQALFEELADKLAIHAAIEERHFYPALRSAESEGLLHEAVHDHLEVKRMLVEIMRIDVEDPDFSTAVRRLKGETLRHVEEEEERLFPIARARLDERALDALGATMQATATALAESDYEPREEIPNEVDRVASLT
jgi:hemerythrin superfamily protein